MPTNIDETQADLELNFPDQDKPVKAPGIDASGSLFKKYFLETYLPQQSNVFKRLYNSDNLLQNLHRQLLEGAETLKKSSGERDTEGELIDPVLKNFGWGIEHRKSLGDGAVDYVLYKTSDDRQSADDQNRYKKATAILEAKDLGTDFEKPRGDETPVEQINRYLKDLQDEPGDVDWGILTDGLKWRIYTKKDFHLRRSFTVNFEEMVEEQSFEKWRPTLAIFYYFFHTDAYKLDKEPAETNRLDHALEEGKNYEERVQGNIKEQIFSEVFPHIARGIYDGIMESNYTVEHYDVEGDQKSARKIVGEFLNGEGKQLEYDRLMSIIRRNANVLMFRLLFLIYAEDRYLLPLNNQKYFEVASFKRIQLKIEEKWNKDPGLYNRDTGDNLWSGIRKLFHRIETGDDAFNLPKYNGGLFDSSEYRIFEEIEIKNEYIAPAVEHLARDHQGEKPRRINWRDMNERQLGSLYEGLLEYRLELAEEEMEFEFPRTIGGEKKKEKIEAGELYWQHEKTERKETGSYYTPDFVVKYIVENTVGEKIEEIEDEFNKKAEELSSKDISVKEAKEELKKLDPARRILDLKVLDPAMGSGHFLVEAVNVLSSGILNNLSPGYAENEEGENGLLQDYFSPIQEELEQEKQEILDNVAAQDLDPEDFNPKLTRENLVRRMVMKRCVFGVDINPLAVELSKLSLWLNSFTVGAPLSFLDHHLRVGNSLVGTTMEEFKEYLQDLREDGMQLELDFTSAFLDSIQDSLKELINISNRSDASMDQVDSSKEDYHEATGRLLPYKRLLDFSLLEHFGVEEAKEELKKDLNKLWNIANCESLEEEEKLRQLEQERQKKYEDYSFFHWDLEFPEIFFDQKGQSIENAGFDAVIGNPPWGASTQGKQFIKDTFRLAEGQFDSWNIFSEKSLNIINRRGFFSFVIPDSILLPEHKGIREFLLNYEINSLIRIGEGAFKDIYRAAFIFVIQNISEFKDSNIHTFQLRKEERNKLIQSNLDLSSLVSQRGELVPHSWIKNRPNSEFELDLNKIDRGIIKKIEQNTIDWGEHFSDSRGVELGKSGEVIRCPKCSLWMPKRNSYRREEQFVQCKHCDKKSKRKDYIEEKIVKEKKINENYSHFAVGEDVNRYHICERLFIDTSFEGVNYKSSQIFEPPKMLVRKTGVGIYSSIDYSKSYFPQVVYVFQEKAKNEHIPIEYIQGVISSRIMLYYYSMIFGEKEWRSFPYVTQKLIKRLPVPDVTNKNKEVVKEIATKVENVSKSEGPISTSKDLSIEDSIEKLFSITSEEKKHIYDRLSEMQNLRIIRELGLSDQK